MKRVDVYLPRWSAEQLQRPQLHTQCWVSHQSVCASGWVRELDWSCPLAGRAEEPQAHHSTLHPTLGHTWEEVGVRYKSSGSKTSWTASYSEFNNSILSAHKYIYKKKQSYTKRKKIRHYELKLYFTFTPYCPLLAAVCAHEAAVTHTQELCWQRPCPEHISGQPSPM